MAVKLFDADTRPGRLPDDDEPPFDRDLNAPTKADDKTLASDLRAKNRREREAFERGRRGQPAAADDDPDVYGSGVEERNRTQRGGGRRPGSARPKASSGPRPLAAMGSIATGKGADSVGGLIVGLFGWALVLSFLREGPHGPIRWLSAKFLNKPLPGPAFAGTSTAGGS